MSRDDIDRLRLLRSRVAARWRAVVGLGPRRSRVLLKPYRAIYVPIPKVASTSLLTAFAGILGVSLERTGGDPHFGRYPSPPPMDALHGILYPGFFSFGFVRNPWDRLVSCYRDKIRNEVGGTTTFTIRPGVADCLARFGAFAAGMSFGAFAAAVASIPDHAADQHFRSQHTFLTNRRGEIAVDFVGRWETLTDDFRAVRERTGLPAIDLPRLQAAPAAVDYRAFYGPETRDLVAKRFAKDIAYFGYEFDSPPVRTARMGAT
jgi:hypothetical protein